MRHRVVLEGTVPGGQETGGVRSWGRLGFYIQPHCCVASGKLRKFPCQVFPEMKKGSGGWDNRESSENLCPIVGIGRT